MSKCLIGIVGKPDNTDRDWSYIEINNEIKECIVNNGALAIGIIPIDKKFKRDIDNIYNLTSEEIDDLKEIIFRCNGIILQGGHVRNSYEQEIIKICLKNDIPLLCICAGFNNMVEALGGKLYIGNKNLHNRYGEKHVHEVTLNTSSKLYKIIGKENIIVNSIHCYVTDLNNISNCIPAAICPQDNTVEAIEVEDKKFAIGIKWHPELMSDEVIMNNIFKKFVEVCENN